MSPQPLKPIGLWLSVLMVLASVHRAEAQVRSPQLISPEQGTVLDNGCGDGSNDMVWTFEWTEPAPEATQYHLYVIGANAANPVINRSDLLSTTYTDISSGSYIADQNGVGWRWYVRAWVDGRWTDWSEPGTFDVEPLNTDCS